MTQPLQQNLPSYDGQNMAPIRPLLALKENNGVASPYSQHYLADAIKEKYKDLIKRDESTFKEILQVAQMTAFFIEGKQILDWNPYTQSYAPRKIKRTDPNKIKAINLMQYYCSEWQAKWGSSNPDIIVSAMSNDDQDISKARKANAIVTHLERKMYDAWYNYHEGMMAQIFGWYGNRVRPCGKNGKMSMQPIMGETEVQIGKGWGKCYDCEHSGSDFNSIQISQDQSMPVCPECGSTGVNYEPPVTQIMPQVTGHQQIKIPDIIAEQLPFAACRWNPKFRAEDSSWFIYEQEVEEGTVRRILGNIRMPEGETGNDVGMEVMRNLGRAGSPLSGRSGVETSTQAKRQALISEVYLSADDLFDIKINGDEQTVDGGILPIGKRASDVFPEGCCAVLLNASLLVGLYAEHHSKTLTSGVYHMKPLSGTGRGIADANEIQKRFNRFDSQAVASMAHGATPATLHLEGAIPANKRHLLGTPGIDIPVNAQNFPEVKDVRQLVSPMQSQSVPGDMIQYTYQYLQEAMQRAYHTTNLGGANPAGIKQNTATYAEINDQNSDALFTPTLSIKADVRLKTAKKAFYLWVKTNPIPQFVPYFNNAKTKGLEVSGPEVDGEYDWSVVPGSELPSDKLSKRKDMSQFFGLFGGIIPYLQAKATNPQEVAETERTFDMDFSTSDYDDVGEVCRTRFEMAKTLLQQSEQLRQQAFQQHGVQLPPADPNSILAQVRPTLLVTEANLEEKVKWFSNLLDTNEGVEMSDEERALVSAFAQGMARLAQGQAIGLQTMAAEAQVASQAPIEAENAAKEQVMSQQQQAQSAQQSAQDHQQGMEQAAQQHAQQQQQQGAQAATELMKQQMQAQAAKEIASAKPKPKGK